MSDPNTDTARKWANEFGPAPILPVSLQNVKSCISLIEALSTTIMPPGNALYLHELDSADKTNRTKAIDRMCAEFLPDVSDSNTRVSISLRLWAGYLDAEKTLSLESRKGLNSPDWRNFRFNSKIDPVASVDQIYRAGVEAAPLLKRKLNQPISFDGVPQESCVRKYQ